MTDETGTEVVILFADVVGSTQLYEALGDEGARAMVQECLTVMREATEHFGGTVIKTMGDEVMATFSSADGAMEAASRMQKRITGTKRLPDGSQIFIRIGCHWGPVVAEERDIFGQAVHTANRMTSQAKAGQVLTTAPTVARLSEEWQLLARQIDVASIKGHAGEMALFEVLWQPEEATSMLPSISWPPGGVQAETPCRLRLRFRGRELVLGDGGVTAVSLGRADENDVVVKGNLISRVHASIDLRKNRFVLVDKSTNGTFIQPDEGEEIYVRRDSAELTGSGIIGMGRVATRGMPLAIEYSCEQQ